MRRLLHISDLHFGRDRPELIEPLVEAINGLAPDLVALSGDLTQRARNAQFRQARAFLDRIEPPVLAVPGNHDVPLDNLPMRLICPWSRYRRWIGKDLEPVWYDDEVVAAGVNTVNNWGWQRGWFTRRDIATVREVFAGEGPGRLRVLVVHHPMEHMPGERKKLMRGSRRAIRTLAEIGVDIVLSGHLHTWRAEPFTRLAGQRSLLQVHAGTGLSTRMRGEENDFNLLTVDGGRVTVERFAVTSEGGTFERQRAVRFIRADNGWRTDGD